MSNELHQYRERAEKAEARLEELRSESSRTERYYRQEQEKNAELWASIEKKDAQIEKLKPKKKPAKKVKKAKK